MKNFDDPNPEHPTPEDLVPAQRPHVEIVGDPARIVEGFRQAAIAPNIAMNKQIRESLLSLDVIKAARENVLKAAMGNLRTIDVPKIDWPAPKIDWPALVGAVPPKIDLSGHMLPRIEPLKIDTPKLPPRVVPADIEAVAAAVNRQIDATEAQTDAIIALHSAMESQAARGKAQADRADNRVAWLVWLTVVLAAYAVLDLLLR